MYTQQQYQRSSDHDLIKQGIVPSILPNTAPIAVNTTNIVNTILPSSNKPVTFNPNSNKDTERFRKSIESASPKTGTTFFMANVTSLSPHALEYLFTKQKDVDILSIVETSIIPTKEFFYKQKIVTTTDIYICQQWGSIPTWRQGTWW